jgi:hypothetical protein
LDGKHPKALRKAIEPPAREEFFAPEMLLRAVLPLFAQFFTFIAHN